VNPVEALGLFVAIPVTVAVIVSVVVLASSWTRSGRVSGDYETGPVLVVSSAPVPDPGAVDASGPGGGVSVRW